MWRGTRGTWVPVSARCGLRTHKAAAIGVSGRKADAEAERWKFRDDFSLQFVPRRFGAGYLVPSDAPMEYHLRAEMHKAQANTFDA